MHSLESPPKDLLKPKTFIAPGGIGTCLTGVQWNRASRTSLGTNKSLTLRFDQYKDRLDITKMIVPCDPHDQRFETITKLSTVNSKFKDSYTHNISKDISRTQACPRNAGNTVNTTVPNCPAKTLTYDKEIPKFYPG